MYYSINTIIIMTSTTIKDDFVRREEFENFKIMTLDRLKTTDEKLDYMTEIMISGFERIDGKLEKIDGKFAEIDARFERIETRLDSHDERFIIIEERIDNLTEIVLDGFDRIYDKIEA